MDTAEQPRVKKEVEGGSWEVNQCPSASVTCQTARLSGVPLRRAQRSEPPLQCSECSGGGGTERFLSLEGLGGTTGRHTGQATLAGSARRARPGERPAPSPQRLIARWWAVEGRRGPCSVGTVTQCSPTLGEVAHTRFSLGGDQRPYRQHGAEVLWWEAMSSSSAWRVTR